MTPIQAAWNRLQCLSCEHSLQIWRKTRQTQRFGNWRKGEPGLVRGVDVPEDIRDNVEILGRGDETEIKVRVHWYITFHPEVFDACSKRKWQVPA